jgi:hypothetical protein
MKKPEPVKAKRRKRGIGASAGKNPAKNIRTELTESKYDTGGAGMKRKKGSIIRRPKATIRYPRKKTD